MSGGVVDRANAGFEEDLREDGMSVLLPCPFCGSAAAMIQLTELPHDDPNWNGWYVECRNATCAATTNIHFGEADKALLEKWNRRAVDHTRRERDALERERLRLNPKHDCSESEMLVLRQIELDKGYWRDNDQFRLANFYAVHTKDALIEAQAKHIEKLQAARAPLLDTQPGRVREG